ncbi:MAG: hypothetical protein ACHQ7M_16455, partial [Chloroflexota bacterium]
LVNGRGRSLDLHADLNMRQRHPFAYPLARRFPRPRRTGKGLGARPGTTPRRPGGASFESLWSVANLAAVVDPVAADGFPAALLG